MPNTILRPSILPIVVAQLDKRLQTEPFCVGVVWEIQSKIVHMREEVFNLLIVAQQKLGTNFKIQFIDVKIYLIAIA